MRRSRKGTIIRGLLTLGAATISASGVAAAEPVFPNDTILHFTVHGPLASLGESTSDSIEIDGLIELDDGTRIPATISSYGISRLRVCSVAPLKFEIPEAAAAGTGFAGLHTVRLVPPCELEDEYTQYVVLEYLAYRSYEVLALPAIRVRPVEFRLRDTGRGSTGDASFAYIVEDLADTARRAGLTWLDIETYSGNDLDLAQLATVALFQYMIGNTDWSPVSAAPGQRCCHNVAVFGAETGRHTTLVPFDFDQAGLVNAPYATADERLGIRRVTQRVYRGYCWHNDEVEQAIETFNEKRAEIEALFNRSDLPCPGARKRALKYLKSFYDTINDPRKVQKHIVKACRG